MFLFFFLLKMEWICFLHESKCLELIYGNEVIFTTVWGFLMKKLELSNC